MVRLGEYRGRVVSAFLGFEKGERSLGEKWRNAQVVVGQARQDRERVPALWPALAHPTAVPEPAIEQLEHLDVVARRGPFGVRSDDGRRDLAPADLRRAGEGP